MLLMIVTYVVPLAALAITYTRVGVELWGHKSIGERTASQDETLRSKRKVQPARSTHLRLSVPSRLFLTSTRLLGHMLQVS